MYSLCFQLIFHVVFTARFVLQAGLFDLSLLLPELMQPNRCFDLFFSFCPPSSKSLCKICFYFVYSLRALLVDCKGKKLGKAE